MSAAVAEPFTVTQAGVYDNLAEDAYHADPVVGGSLSVTGAKVLLKAPALYLWQRTHRVDKAEYDFGHAAHKLVLGEGAELVEVDADAWRTNAAKEARLAARAAGKIPLLTKDIARAREMADALGSHTLASSLLAEGRPEVSAFAVDEATGVMRRGRADWLSRVCIVDYKTTDQSAAPAAFRKTAANLGYHMQDAWYRDLFGYDVLVFVVQEKTAPYLVSVCELDEPAVRRGRELNRRALEVYRDCVAAGVWPGYQPPDGHSLISLPPWAFYDDDQEYDA